jgi:hypothetical protein
VTPTTSGAKISSVDIIDDPISKASSSSVIIKSLPRNRPSASIVSNSIGTKIPSSSIQINDHLGLSLLNSTKPASATLHQHQSPKKQNKKPTQAQSIAKPSASDPFLITTSNDKLTGKSIYTFPNMSHRQIHLPSVAEILPHPQSNPIIQTTSPTWLIPTIAKIIHSDNPPLKDSPFIFDDTPEAAYHNSLVLRQHDNKITNVIDNCEHSIISYGSEFRHPSLLENLLMHHPRWAKFQNIITKGSSWPLSEIEDDIRMQKNKELIERGNHQSALIHDDQLQKILKKEVLQGWMLPIPTTYIKNLHNAEIAPMGIAHQWQAHEDGSRTPKYRLTHDQSFEASIGESVNKRVNKEKLDELYYGHSLCRLLHYIISLRTHFPTTKILIAKTDFKGAYRRVTLHGDTAPRCTVINGDIALVSLRLTFGGAPCPNEFCVISEICADLGNDILRDPAWDPRSLHSPHTIKLSLNNHNEDNTPFTQALPLDVDIPPDTHGKIEIYIDDGITVIPDIGDNRIRGSNAMGLAIHTLCRPISENEPIQRDDCLSLAKLAEEGTLSETALILGWTVNTRSLTISLPLDKFREWRQDLKEIIQNKNAPLEVLECTLGRLNHAASILPLARYFLHRLRKACSPPTAHNITNHSKRYKKWLTKCTIEDLQLFHDTFLPEVHNGIKINLLTYRRPSHILFSDACPSGLGGYSVNTGKAWRWKIPQLFLQSVQNKNNLLEFLASIITTWISLLDISTASLSCILALGDNTSAVGWLHKANTDESYNKALHIAARKYANLLMEHKCCLYSQHFKGEFNNVSDALSRKHQLTDSELTSFIISQYPSQVPLTFEIVPLPQSIISWTTWLLQKNKEQLESKMAQNQRKREFGNDGKLTSPELRMNTTPTSKTWSLLCEPESLEPSAPPSEEETFHAKIRRTWEEAQSKRPWQNWVRCSGQTWGSTPTMDQAATRSTHC